MRRLSYFVDPKRLEPTEGNYIICISLEEGNEFNQAHFALLRVFSESLEEDYVIILDDNK